MIGATVAGSPVLTSLGIRCAPVKCDEQCSWRAGTAYDGPKVGRGGTTARILQCSPGTIVTGYRARAVNDAVGGDLALDCQPIAGPGEKMDSGERLYPIASFSMPSSPHRSVGSSDADQPAAAGLGPMANRSGVYNDTIALNAGRYRSIAERRQYYNSVADLLLARPSTNDVRFFGVGCSTAAKCQNSVAGSGVRADPDDGLGLSDGPRKLLELISGTLLEWNMRVLKSLFVSGTPTIPSLRADSLTAPQEATSQASSTRCQSFAATAISAAATTSGNIQAMSLYCGAGNPPPPPNAIGSCGMAASMTFDLAMVDFDQAIVQRALETDPEVRKLANATSNQVGGDDPWSGATMDEVNRLLNSNSDAVRPELGMLGATDQNPVDWARRRLGVKDLDARKLDHRTAVGEALIFQLHNCAYDDFSSFQAGR